jgi:putative spermidine/putrescine transport system permease protein
MTSPVLAPAAGPPSARLGRFRSALRSRRTRAGLLNAAPILLYLLILFVYPIVGTLSLSLKGEGGGLTLHWYADALSGANLEVLLTTLRISGETAVLSLVIGFVLAYAVSRLRPLWAGLVMVIVVVPHFISALVRTYGWIILLGEHGLVNNLLAALHIPGAPFSLLYNELGVIIGTTSVMLPYTVLVLYGVMRSVDRRLLAAAASMGAGRLVTFRRVYLPLVGGPKQTVIASLIDQQVMKQNQWNGAAAQGVILLVLTFAGLALARLGGRIGAGARNRRAA